MSILGPSTEWGDRIFQSIIVRGKILLRTKTCRCCVDCKSEYTARHESHVVPRLIVSRGTLRRPRLKTRTGGQRPQIKGSEGRSCIWRQNRIARDIMSRKEMRLTMTMKELIN